MTNVVEMIFVGALAMLRRWLQVVVLVMCIANAANACAQRSDGTLAQPLARQAPGCQLWGSRSPRPRQRFTIGHELGHFLLPWHRQASFQCTAEDISSRTNKDWEIQANQFSAEMLMPTSLVKARLLRLKNPELAHVLTLRDEFETSTEMTARRVVELSEPPVPI